MLVCNFFQQNHAEYPLKPGASLLGGVLSVCRPTTLTDSIFHPTLRKKSKFFNGKRSENGRKNFGSMPFCFGPFRGAMSGGENTADKIFRGVFRFSGDLLAEKISAAFRSILAPFAGQWLGGNGGKTSISGILQCFQGPCLPEQFRQHTVPRGHRFVAINGGKLGVLSQKLRIWCRKNFGSMPPPASHFCVAQEGGDCDAKTCFSYYPLPVTIDRL